MRGLIAFVGAILVALCVGGISAQTSENEGYIWLDEEFSPRLSGRVVPTHYTLRFVLDPNQVYMRGEATIDVDVNAPIFDGNRLLSCFGKNECSPKNTIVLHASPSVAIDRIQYFNIDKKGNANEVEVGEPSRDTVQEQIAVRLLGKLKSGRGQLKFSFFSEIRNDMRGVYESTKGAEEYIVTRLIPTDARSVFPCFDEPQMKATFDVSIVHIDSKKAYGTMPTKSVRPAGASGLVETVFERTPKMPTHMVSFVVGNFNEIQATNVGRKNTLVKVLTPVGNEEGAGQFALQVATNSLIWMENYLNMDYPLPKLDVVMIPDQDKENTESWGLVYIADNLGIIDSETKDDSKISAAVNVAHVVVHQWFANLITANWWNHLWCTESIAAQKAFVIVSELYPETQSEFFTRIKTISNWLDTDMAGTKQQLSPPLDTIVTGEEIYEVYDVLKFVKSASLATYIEDQIGSEAFRSAMQSLVRKFAYSTFTTSDYVKAFESASKKSVSKVVKQWSSQKGFPVFVATSGLNEAGEPIVVITQTPSKTTYEEDEQRNGLVELKLNIKFCNEVRCAHEEFVSNKVSVKVKAPSWWSPKDHQHSFKVSTDPDFSTWYRIRYTTNEWPKFANDLISKRMTPMNRLELLDDAAALARAKQVTGDELRNLLNYYQEETDYAVLIEMLIATQTLNAIQPERANEKGAAPWTMAFAKLAKEKGFSVSGQESFLEQRARQVILKTLIGTGNKDLIAGALNTYAAGNVALFLREPVYTAVVVAGTDEQRQQLVAHLRETKSYEERARLATALALSKDAGIVKILEEVIKTDALKEADKESIKKLLKSSSGN